MKKKQKLTYDEAIKIAQKHLKDIRENKQLNEFCREHGFVYVSMVTLLNEKEKVKQPKTLKRLLLVFGYENIDIQKEYFFIVDER